MTEIIEKKIDIENVKSIIIKSTNFTGDPALITGTSDLIKDLKVDSLDFVELVMALEDEFGLEIAEEEAEKLKTLYDVVEFLKKKQSSQEI